MAADVDEVNARWEVHPLSSAADLIRDCLEALASEHLVVISDADGTLLRVEGDPGVRLDAAESINFTEGAAWSEAGAGTNAVGTALAAEHAVQVFAAEHFNSVVQAWVCSAAPVRDPDTARVIGVIDLTSRMTIAHLHAFVSAVATARAVEAQLRSDMYQRDERLRSRHADVIRSRRRTALIAPTGRVLAAGRDGWLQVERLPTPTGGGEIVLPSGARAFLEPLRTGDGYIVRGLDPDHLRSLPPPVQLCLLGTRASVRQGGRALRLSPRHLDILALLTAHRDGMTGEQLAADLYGDAGRPATVRVELSRLRKALGGGIATNPYRLIIDVNSDLRHVGGLLARGAVREAAEAYAGPLLPQSEAPGVIRERDDLDNWLRQTVLTANEIEALWAWVQSPSGRDDGQAWTRLLVELPFRDPRRSLAAATVRALREALQS